jgi:hypothetical protein
MVLFETALSTIAIGAGCALAAVGLFAVFIIMCILLLLILARLCTGIGF